MKKNSLLFSVTVIFLSSCLLVLVYGNLAKDHGSLSSPKSVDHQELEQNNQHHLLDHFRQSITKKCNRPGNPDPNAEIVALSPTTLMTTNRFVCELCNMGFQRDQNLQLHRRGHNLPWKPRQRIDVEVKKRVYVCLEPTCAPHNPTRVLDDLTEIKKHFGRRRVEKKWKCEKCSKKYAVWSDWKTHQKTCGTKECKGL